MGPVLPLSAALALFLLFWAGFRFAAWGFLLALGLGVLAYLGVARWQAQMLRRGPTQAALERLAMKEAWRRGGLLRPHDLSAYMDEGEARALLEGLAARGLCRKEGEGYRF
ncbi:hypothetical protein TJA_01390 [Thermus sp. LT1-2-5]|uniref:hypothetical protein n=1 Tax=Thermus sp. LT1-2-5 TaxID=3026935 RepID=UPI0030EA7EBA